MGGLGEVVVDLISHSKQNLHNNKIVRMVGKRHCESRFAYFVYVIRLSRFWVVGGVIFEWLGCFVCVFNRFEQL